MAYLFAELIYLKEKKNNIDTQQVSLWSFQKLKNFRDLIFVNIAWKMEVLPTPIFTHL